MYRNMAQLYRNNQIIDVTKECTFVWNQEPSSCYAFLEVSNASGDFTDGETVTGGTSNATATVFSSYVDGGRIYIENVNGAFQTGETITDSSGNQTATVDGFTEERSYPNNIVKGTFPDSITSKDIDDYLEWESSRNGSGSIGLLRINVPENGIYGAIIVGGFGIRVDSKLYNRNIQWRVTPTYPSPSSIGMGASVSDFNRFMGISETLTFFPIMKTGNEGQTLSFYISIFIKTTKELLDGDYII